MREPSMKNRPFVGAVGMGGLTDAVIDDEIDAVVVYLGITVFGAVILVKLLGVGVVVVFFVTDAEKNNYYERNAQINHIISLL